MAYTGKVTLQRVHLDRGGYDPFGHYYGVGAPLWWWSRDEGTTEDIEQEGHFRASDRVAAKAHIRSLPGMADCRFYN